MVQVPSYSKLKYRFWLRSVHVSVRRKRNSIRGYARALESTETKLGTASHVPATSRGSPSARSSGAVKSAARRIQRRRVGVQTAITSWGDIPFAEAIPVFKVESLQ